MNSKHILLLFFDKPNLIILPSVKCFQVFLFNKDNSI